MPYGLAKKYQSKKNEAKMERCVSSVKQNSGIDKVTAIKICKARLNFTKDGK